MYGRGSFAAWFAAVDLPGLVFVAGLAIYLQRRDAFPRLRLALSAGVLGGVLATVAYDIVRIPFTLFGYRLFAPVSTYGILMINSPTSSPLTEALGWAYNFMNGIGFALAYAMVGVKRPFWWAIPFALALETTTVVTPYADMYGLRGKYDVIAIAYGAHVFYGAVLGLVVSRSGAWIRPPVPAWWALVAVVVGLLGIYQPWRAGDYAGPASTSVVAGEFRPDWVRIPPGGCVEVVNHDGAGYALSAPTGASVAAHASTRVCFSTPGTIRIQLNQRPYSGGWVLVDPAMK